MESRNRPTHIQSIDFDKSIKTIQLKRVIFSTSERRAIRYLSAKTAI